jgi:hypothetical protein
VTHSDLVNAILLEVSPLGIAWNNNTGALKDATGRLVRYGLAGSSDILACIRGRFVGIEAKVGRDTQRKNQSDFAAAVRQAGGVYILARSVDDVRNTLRLEGLAA